MHISGFSIQGLPPLDKILFRCNEQVNLFVGPNATGKSTILRSMSGLYSKELNGVVLSDELGTTHWLNEVALNGNVGQVAVWVSDDWQIADSVHQTYIPATRINIGALDNDKFIGNFVSPYTMSFSEVLNGTYIERALRALHGQEPGDNMEDALNHAFRCAQSICHEIILDGPHPHTEIHYDEKRGRSVRMDPAMGIGTIDDARGTPLHVSVLSSGTQGTLLWVYALAVEMAGHYEFELGWENKPAILLIDEIENHLHPTWQRRVIPALLEHFSGLQIFATTHSPFVVAGLKAGQVHLLKRDSEGRVTASTNTEDIIGWTADEILRTMMDVDEPTDQLTVDRTNRLRELRRQEKLTSAEESELNTLRRQVSEALLFKGGPIEAQRERYADLMQRFLLSRQSDMTQDGE